MQNLGYCLIYTAAKPHTFYLKLLGLSDIIEFIIILLFIIFSIALYRLLTLKMQIEKKEKIFYNLLVNI